MGKTMCAIGKSLGRKTNEPFIITTKVEESLMYIECEIFIFTT